MKILQYKERVLFFCSKNIFPNPFIRIPYGNKYEKVNRQKYRMFVAYSSRVMGYD